MARGFVWGAYLDDDGTVWRLLVDGDYIAEEARGWVTANPEAVAPLPRQWLPRRAVGHDAEGRRRSAVVATLSAPLWTGATTTFFIEGNDNVVYPVTVTELLSERRR